MTARASLRLRYRSGGHRVQNFQARMVAARGRELLREAGALPGLRGPRSVPGAAPPPRAVAFPLCERHRGRGTERRLSVLSLTTVLSLYRFCNHASLLAGFTWLPISELTDCCASPRPECMSCAIVGARARSRVQFDPTRGRRDGR